MRSRFKALAINLSLLAVSTLLALLIGEGVLRLSASHGLRQTHQQLFVEHDPVLGWRKKPNTTGTYEQPEFSVRETFNSKGLRGPEYSYEKPQQEYRILVLGDSFAEGYTVSFDELFSEVLGRTLVHPDKEVLVINAGTGGYSTDQEFLFFTTEGKKYTPNLTILLFYMNDVWYNGQPRYWRGFKPYFELLDNGQLSLVGVPVPLPQVQHADSSGLQRVKRWLGLNSHLYRLVADLVNKSPVLKRMAVELGIKIDLPEEFEVLRKEQSPQYRELWQLTETLLLELKDEAASVGSQFLVFYVPFRASIYPDDWDNMKREYGLPEEDWNPEQPGIVLREICERNDLQCLDPTESFRETDERLYFHIDGHWNPAGNRVVGEMLAGFIEANFLEP